MKSDVENPVHILRYWPLIVNELTAFGVVACLQFSGFPVTRRFSLPGIDAFSFPLSKHWTGVIVGTVPPRTPIHPCRCSKDKEKQNINI